MRHRSLRRLQLFVAVLTAGLVGCLPGETPDAGPACERPDPCAGEPLGDTVAELVAASAERGALLRVGDTELVMGEASRLDVQMSLGFGDDTTGNAFRQVHCDLRVQLQYVDDTTGDEFDGAPNGDDLLARVITTAGSPATLATLTDGASLADAEGAIGGTSISRAGATLVVDGEAGTSAFVVGDVVDHLGVFIPQTTAPWDLPFNIDAASLGGGADEVSTSDGDLDDLPPLLGAPTKQGIAEGDVLLVDAWISTWPALGVRGAGACPVLGDCDDTINLTSILLSSPFMGSAESDLGLWSTKEDVDAHFGSSGTEIDGLTVYSGSTDVGFLFTDAEDCTLRVAGLVLDYRTSP